MRRKIIITTSAYGADYIKSIGGQGEILTVIKASGADGVEIRRELFSDEVLSELPRLANKIKQAQLACFYSVPFPLWISPEKIHPQLRQYFAEARQLNADLLKFSLGDFKPDTPAVLADTLKQIMDMYPEIQCVIENDQAKKSGNLNSMVAFTQWLTRHHVPLRLAFDSGNWAWAEQDPQLAAQQLAAYVGYIHIKSTALDTTGKRITVPPKNQEDRYLQIVQRYLPQNVARGIEFPLIGGDLVAISRHFVELLRG
ncbi:sugar phosphate isomerase/epimerase family protein [Testudinibacter sp. P80/BLE/0925]|uniref:sugar phosphate isomerase/epimerase family protein n=1 Tax=Testudinibacter sp. TW-1 TaxID=3417757 RepID=UPI003D369821